MGFQRFFASQLRQPSGWFGSVLMGRLLNRVNRQIIDATIDQLEIRPEHNVLEIGFGGGIGLERLLARATTGVIAGVDISAEMVQKAKGRFGPQIAQGRLHLYAGDVSALPCAAATFDRLFTINTIYFWPDVPKGLAEIKRVLRPGALAAISIRSKEKMEKHAVSKHGFRLFSPDDVASLMRDAGFADVRVDHRDRDKWYDQVIVIGTR